MIQCEGCYYQDKKENVCCHENPFFDIDDNCTDYIEDEFVKKIRADAIMEFAEYLAMSYDKGMRLSVAKTKSETEKFKIKAIYTQFLDAIPMCVESFAQWKEYEKEQNK